MTVSHLKQKLGLTLGYLLVVSVFFVLDLPCIFQWIFHIPCPGCGMTRALLAACRFDFSAAFSHHAMFWSLPILYAYFLLDHGIWNSKRANTVLLVGIAVGFLGNWLWHISLV